MRALFIYIPLVFLLFGATSRGSERCSAISLVIYDDPTLEQEFYFSDNSELDYARSHSSSHLDRLYLYLNSNLLTKKGINKIVNHLRKEYTPSIWLYLTYSQFQSSNNQYVKNDFWTLKDPALVKFSEKLSVSFNCVQGHSFQFIQDQKLTIRSREHNAVIVSGYTGLDDDFVEFLDRSRWDLESSCPDSSQHVNNLDLTVNLQSSPSILLISLANVPIKSTDCYVAEYKSPNYKVRSIHVESSGEQNLTDFNIILEKPIFNYNVTFDSTIEAALNSVEIRSVLTSFIPSAIREARNLRSFGMSVLGYSGDFEFLSSYSDLEELKLYNCAKLSPVQSEQILRIVEQKRLKKLTLTYLPSKAFLVQFLEKCKNLEELEIDLNTLSWFTYENENASFASWKKCLRKLKVLKLAKPVFGFHGYFTHIHISALCNGLYLGDPCLMPNFVLWDMFTDEVNPFALTNEDLYDIAMKVCNSGIDYTVLTDEIISDFKKKYPDIKLSSK